MSLTITVCRDAALVAAIHRETVATAYAPFFPPDAPLPSPEEFERTWERRLALPTVSALLATRGEKPVGLAAVGSSGHESGAGELLALFVRCAGRRRGVGSALHDAALRRLVDGGDTSVGLWVIAANTRARRFYEAHRWELVPERTQSTYPTVPEVRYTRATI